MWFDRSPALLAQADAASRKALELAPDLAEAHASRGLALSLNRKYQESEEEFEIAIRLNPRLFEAFYFYARDSVGQGKLEKAARLFKSANDARPEDYQSLLLLSQCCRGLGRLEEAREAALRGIETAEKHLELNPEDTRALYLGAAALVIYADKQKGLAWAQRAANLDPEEKGMLYQLACIYSLAGEIEQAIDYLEEWEKKGALPKEWVEHDSDLHALGSHPRFQALMARLP
jgi:adenylate cyclase